MEFISIDKYLPSIFISPGKSISGCEVGGDNLHRFFNIIGNWLSNVGFHYNLQNLDILSLLS